MTERKHEWLPGGYGHGLAHCKWCGCTDREAAFALGQVCPKAPERQPDGYRYRCKNDMPTPWQYGPTPPDDEEHYEVRPLYDPEEGPIP